MITEINTTENIKKLIHHYFQGNTSYEEEKMLRLYFSQQNTDPEVTEYKSFFSSLHQLSNHPECLKDETCDLPTSTNISLHNKPSWRNILTISSVAASVAAIFFMVYLTHKPIQTTDYVMINGIKYTDSKSIETAMNTSLANVKIETEDLFSDFKDIQVE